MQNDGPVIRQKILPPELHGWNWGAFFLNWVWGLAHNTWIALLMFVPVVNVVMMFVLGVKGNQWAWANNEWRDVEHFKHTQRIWARVGFGAVLGVPLFFGLIFGIVMASFTSSDAYLMTVDYLRAEPRLERPLGLPVQPSGWWTTGNIELHGNEGQAELGFDVAGPKGTGTVFAALDKSAGLWTIRQLSVLTENGEQILLVKSHK